MRHLIITLFVASLAGCATDSPQFESDPSVDLVALKRFVWHTAPRNAAPVTPLDSEILQKRLRVSASAELARRGFTPDETAPQFRVGALLLVKPKAKPAPTFSIGLGVGSYGNSSGGSVSVGGSTAVGKAKDQLTLVIEMRDPTSDELLWQGWREVEEPIGDAAQPALDSAVAAILADFPVPAKGSAKKKR